MIYLSICIPTKNRLDYIKTTINSIIDDDVDNSLFQIIISDNSDNDHTEKYAKELQANGYNIKYYRNPVSGFYNSIQALRLGDGELLKLHNDYSAFKRGKFKSLLEYAVKHVEIKPILFFTNGELKYSKKTICCDSLDDFVSHASYLITWSSSFAIWREQLQKLRSEPQDVDEMFPHTSVLLQTNNKKYCIVDEILFENINVTKKGGYNIFYNFCILFLNILYEKVKENTITKKTFQKVKRDMYYRFVIIWYYRTIIDKKRNYTFDNTNANQNIKKAYGLVGLLGVKCISNAKYIISNFRNFFSK